MDDSKPIRRRPFILSLPGMISISGCMGFNLFAPPNADGDHAPDKDDDYPNDPSRVSKTESKSVTISVDNKYHIENWWTVAGEGAAMDFTVDVQNGPPLNILVFDAEQYKRYRKGKSATPVYRAEKIYELEDTVTYESVYDAGVAAHFILKQATKSPQSSKTQFSYVEYF